MIRLVDRWVEPALGFLAGWSVRWGVLILALAAWFRLLPPRGGAHRHLLVAGTLVTGLLLPVAPTWTAPAVWTRFAPVASRTISPPPDAESAHPFARSVGPFPNLNPPGTTPVGPAPPDPPPVREAPASRRPVASDGLGWGRAAWLTLGSAWLVGTAWFLVQGVVGQVLLIRLRRTSQPVTGASLKVFDEAKRASDRLGRQVELASHAGVGSPVVLGGWRATVLVPADWATWPAATQRACLLHELAHLARRDDAWKLLAELARAPFWFHPAVAWLQARLDREAELACDEAAVALGVPPVELARLLLACARRPHRLDPRACFLDRPALSFLGRDTVSARITRLLENPMTPPLIRPSRLQIVGLILSGAALAGAIGGARVAAVEPPRPLAPGLPPQNPTPVAVAPVIVTIRDSAGRPVAGANVLLRKREGVRSNTYRTLAEAQSDAAGLIRFDRLTESGDWLLIFQEGYSCRGDAC